MNRLRSTSQKDRFQHQWVLDKNLSFCEKTGLNWLVYVEGRGMFCLLCRKHDVTNLQNKSKKFNTEPAVRFKRKSVEEHSTSQQHKAAVSAELLSRVSVFQKEFEEREKSKEDVYFNAFLALYWIAKEEIANTKFTSLLEVVEKMGLSNMKFFEHRSGGSVREMFILMGEMVKSEVVKKAQQAGSIGLLIDEVMDIAQREQLVSFIRYVDQDTYEVKTDFLAVNDILESSSSANAETIKSVVVKQLSDCDLDINKLTGLSTDGVSVMVGKENGVAAKLKREAKMLLNVHCICHRLALACGDANDHISYIKTVEKVLIQLWSFFHNSGKRTAAFTKAVIASAELQISHSAKKRVVKRVKKATRTRWLSTESTVDGIFLNFVPLTQTLQNYSNERDPVAINLITQIKSKKFLGAVYLLHEVLPILSHLSRAFQKGNISFAVIAPSVEFILEELKSVAEKQSPLERLRTDLAEDGRLHNSGLTPLTAHDETLLKNLTSKYVRALQDNIASRFKDSLPILSAFKIFDPVAVPPKSEQSFSDYGSKEIKILAEYLYQLETGESKVQKTEELICEWRKFKYSILKLKSEMPADVVKPPKNKELTSQTPTEWLLHHMLSNQSTYSHFVPELLRLAEVCMSLPVSNAWPERGASAVKRLKTRLRSSLKGDMLESLMHITINGPEVQECESLVKKTVKKWHEVKPRRKIAKSIPASASTSETTVSKSNAAVQVDMPLDVEVLEHVNAIGDGIGVEDLEKEVNSVISALKLPDISDSDMDSHSDYDSDFESDSD